MDIQGTPDWSAGCVLYQALAPIGPFSHACCADTDVSQDAPDWFKIKHSRVAKRPMSPNERVCRLPAYAPLFTVVLMLISMIDSFATSSGKG